MKAAALMLGIALLSASASVAEPEAEQGRIARGERKAITPNAPGGGAGVLDVPAATARSEQLLPPHLITTSPEGKDLEFLMSALENGRVQAWLGDVAIRKAEREAVRDVGASLQKAQSRETKLIVQLAKRKGLNVEENDRPIQLNAIASRLPQAPGPKLDKALIEHIIVASQNAVSVYERGLHSRDEEIRKLSEQMLPEMKVRLQRAKSAAGEVR